MPPHGSLQGYQPSGHFPSQAIKSKVLRSLYQLTRANDGLLLHGWLSDKLPSQHPTPGTRISKCEQEESQIQVKVSTYLQQEQANQGKHEKLNTFGVMCNMAGQTLFTIVEWARSSIFFREQKVDDQAKLLQNCWSELLILDHICRVTLTNLVRHSQELVLTLSALHFGHREFVCLKFLVLFNLDVKNLENFQLVESVQNQVHAALLDYTVCNYPQQTEKFRQLHL
ncbi:hypothetical protein ACRRTK_018386 [Alexandromys fortis]